MSDLSTLTNQYDQLVAITDHVNDSVNILVKSELVTEHPEMSERPNFQISEEQVTHAKGTLRDFAQTLLTISNKEPMVDVPIQLPNVIVEEYQQRLRKKSLQRNFRNLIQAIDNEEPVTQRYEGLLEDIVTTLDGDCLQFYKKFRGRG